MRGQISKGICPCSFVPFQIGARRGNAADASFRILKGVGAMGRVLSLLRRAVQHGGIACMQILQKKGCNKEKEKGKRVITKRKKENERKLPLQFSKLYRGINVLRCTVARMPNP